MSRVAFSVKPALDATGDGEAWESTSDSPWLELSIDPLPVGRWIRIIWHASFCEIPCRPVLRFASGPVSTDMILTAAIFGRGQWTGVVPPETDRIYLSPVNRPGPFRFRVANVESVPALTLIRDALSLSPGRAALALLDRAIGLRRHADINLRIALRNEAARDYRRWRAKRVRPPEADGFDKPSREAEAIHVRLLTTGDDMSCRQSLERQTHANWSLRASPSEVLARASRGRKPALTRDLEEALEGLSDGDLAAFLPGGASLPPHALLALTSAAAAHPEADAFYGDEEILSRENDVVSLRARPGPDELLDEAGKLSGFATFWRAGRLRGSLPSARKIALFRPLLSLPLSAPAGAPADDAAVSRKREDAAPLTEAAIIVPTRDRLNLLRPCIESILSRTDGPFRIVIVDNDSKDPAALAYLDEIASHAAVIVLRRPGPFNYSRLCNDGARAAGAPLLVFLNNDTEILHSDWLAKLGRFAMKPGVGAVGAKLLFPSGRVQHAGVVLGLHGTAGHIEAGVGRDDPGFFGRLQSPHHMSAATGACVAVAKERFDAVGGFDEADFPIELNDVDLCLRLLEHGFPPVIATDCVLLHHESASRGRSRDHDYLKERSLFRQRWSARLRADPHFHPGLSLESALPRLG